MKSKELPWDRKLDPITDDGIRFFAGRVPSAFLDWYIMETTEEARQQMEARLHEVVRWRNRDNPDERLPRRETVADHLGELLHTVYALETECPQLVKFLETHGETSDMLRKMFLVHDLGETEGGVNDITSSDQQKLGKGIRDRLHKKEEQWAVTVIRKIFLHPEHLQTLYVRFHRRNENPNDVLAHLARLMDVTHGVQQGSKSAYPHRARHLADTFAASPDPIASIGHGDTLSGAYYIGLFEKLGYALRSAGAPPGVFDEIRTFFRMHLMRSFVRGYAHAPEHNRERRNALILEIENGLCTNLRP